MSNFCYNIVSAYGLFYFTCVYVCVLSFKCVCVCVLKFSSSVFICMCMLRLPVFMNVSFKFTCVYICVF